MASKGDVKSEGSEVEEILKDFRQKEQVFTKDGGDGARRALIDSACALIAELESPADFLERMNWLEPERYAAIRTAIDLNLFEAMVTHDGSPKSATELARATGADVELLDRLLKIMAADNVIVETGPSRYRPNGVSKLLSGPVYQGMVADSFDGAAPALLSLPRFLKINDYKNPTDQNNTPWQMAQGTKAHYFTWLNQPEQSARLVNFNNHMTSKGIRMKHWFTVVDSGSIFGPSEQLNPESPLLVDIGGNVGHDLLALESALSHNSQYHKTRLVLQDLPEVVKNVTLPSQSKIQIMPHDFFTTQPVKGARIYYLHMVLHDWPDHKCEEILAAIKPAMEKGYSKILINDAVIPAQNAGWRETGIDFIMMAVHCATERTEKHWERLLNTVGLKIVKIWDCDGSPEKVIEAELID